MVLPSRCNSSENVIYNLSRKHVPGSSVHSLVQRRRRAGRGELPGPGPAWRNHGPARGRDGEPGRRGLCAGAATGQRAEGRGQRGRACVGRRGGGRQRAAPPRLTSGCLRRMCLLMEALVDTLVPHSWQLWASTLSWVSCTCFCSMYSVTYFLSHTEHVHCLPTSHTHGPEERARVVSGVSLCTCSQGRRPGHPPAGQAAGQAARPPPLLEPSRYSNVRKFKFPTMSENFENLKFSMSKNSDGLSFWGQGAIVKAEQHQNI